MISILTATGWSSKEEVLFEEVKQIFENDSSVQSIKPLNWQIPSSFQKVQDFIDSRESQEVILDLSEQILSACRESKKIVIISYSTGSLLVEEALTLVFKSPVTPVISHVMLAPAINGSSWASLGKIAKLGLMLLIGKGIFSDRFNILSKVFMGVFGIELLRSLFSKETILDKLENKFKSIVLDEAPIERTVLIGERDVVVRDIPQTLPNTTYYTGDFDHFEVGSLDPNSLDQIYRNNKDHKLSISKKQLLIDIIHQMAK